MKTEEKILFPIGDRILVQMLEDEGEVSSKVLHIPDVAKGESRMAVVECLGTEREDNKPWPVNLGDNILLAQFVGVNIKIDHKPCKIISTSDILGVYRKV